MKILITSDTWSPVVNGVVRSCELLYHALLAQGHDVRVLTLSMDHETHAEGRVVRLGSLDASRVYPGTRIGAWAPGQWVEELIRWHPDVIHTQSEVTTFVLARRIAHRCGCPIVHTYHTVYEDYTHYIVPSERLGRATVARATKAMSERCNMILAPTEKVRVMLEGYGVTCPVRTVPTGIDLKAFRPIETDDDNAERLALRSGLGIPADAFCLVSIGRLAAEKNHGELLRLAVNVPQAWLVFVGDGPVRAELECTAAKLGISDRVRFAGMIEPSQVAAYYRMGDAFVSASQSETQGLTYFEALACGLPVICRADPCLDGVIENGVNGWQWSDEAGFAEAIDAMVPAETRAVLHENALATAARYSAEHFAQQAVEAYKEAINNKRGGDGAAMLRAAQTATAIGFFCCLCLGIWAWRRGILTDINELQTWAASLGWWAPAAFVVFQAVQVVIPILPGGLGCLAGIVLFGPLAGFIYNYIGICAGSLAAFAVARHCGRPLLERMFSQRQLRKYSRYTDEMPHFEKLFAVAIFMPVAPDDFLCYLAGTTGMSWERFTIIILACKPFAIATYSAVLTGAMNALLSV